MANSITIRETCRGKSPGMGRRPKKTVARHRLRPKINPAVRDRPPVSKSALRPLFLFKSTAPQWASWIGGGASDERGRGLTLDARLRVLTSFIPPPFAARYPYRAG